jgi:hypothetical protein
LLTMYPLVFMEVTHFLTAKTFASLCTACNIKTGYKLKVNEWYCKYFSDKRQVQVEYSPWVKIANGKWVRPHDTNVQLNLMKSLETLFTRRSLGPDLAKDKDEEYMTMFDTAADICGRQIVSLPELQTVQDRVVQMLHTEKLDRMEILLNHMECRI